MVRVSSSPPHYDYLTRTRQLPVNIHRGHSVDHDVWGWCDLPIRLYDAPTVKRDLYGEYYEPASPSPYELQVMMVWGSWKAMLGMMSEQDVVEGMGVRVALGLARENP